MWRKKSSRVDAVFIGTYTFPPGMVERALVRCPDGTSRQALEVGLRQFLTVAGRRAARGATAAMPSRTVDEAWHEFLTYTRDYAAFCERAFGRFLHHDPEVAMTDGQVRVNQSAAFAATWIGACELEGRDPWTTEHAPWLFSLDRDSGVPGAPSYVGSCGADDPCRATDDVVCMTHAYLGPRPASTRNGSEGAYGGGSCGSSSAGHGSGSGCGSSSCGGSGCGGGGCGGGS